MILQLIVPHCQSDFRRTVHVLELISGFIQRGEKIDAAKLLIQLTD